MPANTEELQKYKIVAMMVIPPTSAGGRSLVMDIKGMLNSNKLHKLEHQ